MYDHFQSYEAQVELLSKERGNSDGELEIFRSVFRGIRWSWRFSGFFMVFWFAFGLVSWCSHGVFHGVFIGSLQGLFMYYSCLFVWFLGQVSAV